MLRSNRGEESVSSEDFSDTLSTSFLQEDNIRFASVLLVQSFGFIAIILIS